MDQSNVPSKTAEAGHELSDLSAKNVALFGIILAVIIVAAVLVTAALFRHFYTVETTSQVAPSPLSYSREPTPGPKLTVNPGQDLQTMRAAEDAALNNYEWVDREKGIVRIPVDRAIEILAQKGLPARPQGSGKTIEEKPQGRKNKAAQGNQMIDKTVDAIPRPQAQSRLPFIQSSKFRSSRWIFNLALPLVVILSGGAWAHDSTRPPALRDVAFDQKLNQQVPLGLAFRDESGKTVQLADYIKQKPVILTFVYYKCRDLCPLLLDGVVRSLRALSFDAGNQFDLITLSIDAHDGPALAAAKKKDIIDQYSRPGAAAGWHFLTGDEAEIQKLTQSVGFHYTYDPHTGEFAHASGIVLLTPKGRTARYYYGIDFSPRDLRLGLIEAAAGKIGSPIDQLLLFCYHYDPVTGKYGLLITNVIRLAGAATVVILGAFILIMLRRERSNATEGGKTA